MTYRIPAGALAPGVVVRSEKVELLSVAGSIVCVSGAGLMRGARNSMEGPAAIVCKTDGSFCEVSKGTQSGLRNANENPAR